MQSLQTLKNHKNFEKLIDSNFVKQKETVHEDNQFKNIKHQTEACNQQTSSTNYVPLRDLKLISLANKHLLQNGISTRLFSDWEFSISVTELDADRNNNDAVYQDILLAQLSSKLKDRRGHFLSHRLVIEHHAPKLQLVIKYPGQTQATFFQKIMNVFQINQITSLSCVTKYIQIVICRPVIPLFSINN